MIQILFCHNFHQDVSRFTVHKGLRPNSRTDDERTGPGYMNQLACEQKKGARVWISMPFLGFLEKAAAWKKGKQFEVSGRG